jgi:hypothetical protein
MLGIPGIWGIAANSIWNELPAISGMLGIPGIGRIIATFTGTSFQQHQGCLGSQKFEGLLQYPSERDSSNIRDPWDPRDLRDCCDFH